MGLKILKYLPHLTQFHLQWRSYDLRTAEKEKVAIFHSLVTHFTSRVQTREMIIRNMPKLLDFHASLYFVILFNCTVQARTLWRRQLTV
jgi:hypothetical protein